MPRIPQRLGDAPIDLEYRERMNVVAGALDQMFNGEKRGDDREVGFVLLVFPFGEAQHCNFISNGGDRQDIVALFKAMIAHFQGQPEMKGRG
jgi:hypothetical protein